MKLTVSTHGGWTGRLTPPRTIDTDVLPPQAAEEGARLAQAAQAVDRPERQAMQAEHAPEAQRYTITIEDGDRTTTVRLSDTAGSPAARALLEWVQAQGG